MIMGIRTCVFVLLAFGGFDQIVKAQFRGEGPPGALADPHNVDLSFNTGLDSLDLFPPQVERSFPGVSERQHVHHVNEPLIPHERSHSLRSHEILPDYTETRAIPHDNHRHFPDNRCRRIRCSSVGFRYRSCPQNRYIASATLSRQISRSRCTRGRSYGYRNRELWVNNGCRGDFTVCFSSGSGHGSTETVSCSSPRNRYRTCGTRRNGYILDVELVRQISNARCRKGRTFGAEGRRIWVDNGCRGTFRVYF